MNSTDQNRKKHQEFNETAERLESLKAGMAAASLFGLLFLVLWGVESWVGLSPPSEFLSPSPLAIPTELLRAGIALLTGFLFGVTYRYILRQDTNRQLQVGAIVAFGLIRGLAQVELLLGQVPLAALRLLGNLLSFAVVGFALSWMMQQGWVQRCPDRR
ncbi:MAG: hypothetical protein IGS38_10475 [Synechococcales cyanobacterium M58_A2018_015]|nr:hypothetical protein [Synechococcales cyanobacterium M58_A2018_015]